MAAPDHPSAGCPRTSCCRTCGRRPSRATWSTCCARRRPSSSARPARRQLRGRAGRVLRRRRAQRLRQEHPAEVHRRHLPAHHRDGGRRVAGWRRSSSSASASTPSSPGATTCTSTARCSASRDARSTPCTTTSSTSPSSRTPWTRSSRTTPRACRSASPSRWPRGPRADILLIDEVLAVGDAAFQQKCFDHFRALKTSRHDHRLRHPRHGRRAPVLRPRHAHRGRRLVAEGERGGRCPGVHGALHAASGERAAGPGSARGSGSIRYSKVTVPGLLAEEDALVLELEARADQDVEEPVFGFLIKNSSGAPVLGTTRCSSARRRSPAEVEAGP